MNKFKAIGDFLPKDSEGFFVNPCSSQLIKHPWDQAVAEVIQQYRDRLGENLHSLYLRGSIPQGRALEKRSDVDSFAVIKNKTPTEELIWVREAQKTLASQFPFVLHFEFQFYPLQQVLKDEGFLSVRFLIKCLSLCIAGEDLAPAIQRFKPGIDLGKAFYGNFGEILNHVLHKLHSINDSEEIKRGCSFIMKRILRTGFGMCIGEERKFTRDLFLCFQVFSKYYPEREAQMQQALEWALDPISEKKTLIPFLETFGFWLAKKAERKFSAVG